MSSVIIKDPTGATVVEVTAQGPQGAAGAAGAAGAQGAQGPTGNIDPQMPVLVAQAAASAAAAASSGAAAATQATNAATSKTGADTSATNAAASASSAAAIYGSISAVNTAASNASTSATSAAASATGAATSATNSAASATSAAASATGAATSKTGADTSATNAAASATGAATSKTGADTSATNAAASATGAATSATGAATSATNAAASAVTANTSGINAAASAASSVSSAASAVNARDAALAAARIYATTAAGIAATTSGQYFYMPSADPAESVILYLNNAGTAVDQKHYASAVALARLAVTVVPNAVHAVQDPSINAALVVEAGGRHLFSNLDSDVINGTPRSTFAKLLRTTPALRSSISHRISYGQSLSLGQGGSVVSIAGTDSGFFDSLRFSANGVTTAGPRTQEGLGTDAQNHSSFVPYIEQPISGGTPTGNFESPLGNALRMVKRLLRDEDMLNPADAEYILLGSAPGESNTAIAGLSKVSTPYTRLMVDVTYGLSLSQAAGKSYAVDAIYWSQGEADINAGTTRAAYLAAFLQLYTDLNTDIKAATGQTHNIKIIGYQCSTVTQTNPNIALAQLDAAKANPSIILATSVYAVEHLNATNPHLVGFGYAANGAYFALADKRTVIDGKTFANFYPIKIIRQGNILHVDFADTGYPIAISNTLFDTLANAGLTAVNGSGADNPITSVTVIGPSRIRVVLTSAVAGSLRYGFLSWGGNIHNLCDLDSGIPKTVPLYQPCLSFEESFA